MKQVETERMFSADADTNPVDGRVRVSPAKCLWYCGHFALAVVGCTWFFQWGVLTMCGFLTAITLCCGHTVGLHRLLIHRSIECPIWLERALVYLGILVGMGGPFGMIRLHDIRDWAQRHTDCHAFFMHRSSLLKDWWWNMACTIDLSHPPRFEIEQTVAKDPFYRFLQRTWMAHQLPLAIVLFLVGGWPWVLWGISVRIILSLTGHWLVGYFAHRTGSRTWHLEGHAVQGFNLHHLGWITMGECWHNNHHAFPHSARLGLGTGQADPGWWFVCLLRRLGLVRRANQPGDLPARPELTLLSPGE